MLPIPRLAVAVLGYFEARDRGGCYFTAHDQETPIQRPCQLADEATPSGNGVAATGLLKFDHLLGESRYIEAPDAVCGRRGRRSSRCRLPTTVC